MKRITDVTRQDIIDIIKDGLWIPYEEPKIDNDTGETIEGYAIRMPISGRLSELDFLGRIYDLEHMPSTDSRFINAKQDITKHTILNDDWEPNWYLTDERFCLSNGNDDSYLLKFICEMLHPAVRDEKTRWREYLKVFNKLLEPDGYTLVSVRNISGREVFEAREIDHIVIDHSKEPLYASMKLIGEGAYAQVFRYHDEFYHKDFALKRAKLDLDEKELERFKREFEQMNSLHSPYIVEVYSYHDDKNEYTMESMDFSLQYYIAKHNDRLTVRERRNIINQILHAFRYLHSKNILHRDISIKNVLLKQYEDEKKKKISDFGLVKVVDSDLTSTNTDFKGTLNDPSLKVEGFKNYNLLHEIYALTLLITYVLTGKQRWDRITEPTIKDFVDKGTNPVKEKRFQSLDELSQAVAKCYEVI